MNPKLSRYAQLHGEFNYDATTLAPPGTQVIIHENPTVVGTWAYHGVKGQYLGSSMNHYRCHHVYITKKEENETQIVLSFYHITLHSPTILPHKMSSPRRMNYPMH